MPAVAGREPANPNILPEPPEANFSPGPELSGLPVDGDLSSLVREPASCSPNIGVLPPLAYSTLWVFSVAEAPAAPALRPEPPSTAVTRGPWLLPPSDRPLEPEPLSTLSFELF